MAFSEEDKATMDSAAADAQNDLVDMPDEALTTVANWFKKWHYKAGHKRLGRILIEYADKEKKGG